MRLKFLWWGLAGGAVLTVVTGALGYFGGGVGYRVAQLLALPAIGSSHLAYHFGVLSIVDGLLADPGATFCFASPEQRLSSHLRAGFPPLAALVGACSYVAVKIRRSS